MSRPGQKGDYIVVDGVAGPTYAGVNWPLVMSEDGESIATSARAGWDDTLLLLNGRAIANPRGGYPFLGADGSTVGCIGEECILVGGERIAIPGYVLGAAIDGAGKLAAYAYEHEDGTLRMRWGEREWTLEARPREMAVSRDGRTLAWTFSRESAGVTQPLLIVGDKRYGVAASELRFAPDGRLTYVTSKKGQEYLVVGEREYRLEGKRHLQFQRKMRFSPDMKRAAYATVIGRELWWKVIKLD